jgi:hypothetical protein
MSRADGADEASALWPRRVLYRVGQFWAGLRARVTPEETALARRILGPRAASLFGAMPVDAQRHSLDVLASLGAAAQAEPELAVAALLHDVGKVAAARRGLGLWLRGPLVLLEALLPGVAAAWAVNDPRAGWRYVLYVQTNHPAIGATWAAAAGCGELACWLIAHHQQRLDCVEAAAPRRALLAALQRADAAH